MKKPASKKAGFSKMKIYLKLSFSQGNEVRKAENNQGKKYINNYIK